MQLTNIRVPGKVMLSGEYAVLYGGSAVLIPVPRFMEISETDSPESDSSSPVVSEALTLDIPAISSFEHKHGCPHVKVNRNAFYEANTDGRLLKLGLGSSAAEAVGVIKLRLKRAGFRGPELINPLMEFAFRAHDKAQGMLGSGADVAACAIGEPIKYSSKFDIKSGAISRTVVGLPIECKYPLNLVWTGVSANTPAMVRQFGQWLNLQADQAKMLLAQLVLSANALADSWFNVPLPQLLIRVDEFSMIMGECADQAGIIYRLPIHEKIEKWAIANGGRAKPTGGGGGDMILLIGELPLNELNNLIIPLSV